MSETDFLKLKKHDNVETNTEKFDIENYLNGNWDKIDENVGEVNTNISNINSKNKEQDTNIKQLQGNTETSSNKIVELEKELKEMQEDFYQSSIRGQASGEYIHVEDSSNCRAKIGIVGNHEQETRSGKNKIEITKTTTTVNGCTHTIKDGTDTLSGTSSTNWANLIIYSFVGDGKTYTLSGSPSTSKNIFISAHDNVQKKDLATSKNGSTGTFVATSGNSIDIIICVAPNLTLANELFKPQLEEGLKATGYEQGGAMPSLNYPSEIKTVGDNVNLFPGWENGTIDSTSGEKKADPWYIRCKDFIPIVYGVFYTISQINSVNFNDMNCAIRLYDKDKKYLGSQYVGNFFKQSLTFTVNNLNVKYIIPVVSNGRTVPQNAKTDIKLEKGTVATPYSSHGQGNVKITKCNKNLLDSSILENKILNSKTGIATTNTSWRVSDFIQINSGIYNFSWKSSLDYFQVIICFYDRNKNFLSGISWGISNVYSKSFEVDENTTFIRVSYSTTVNGKEANREKIILEQNSTATDYEQHEEQIYIMPVQQEMLVNDYPDYDNEEEVHVWGKKILTGDEGWRMPSSNDTNAVFTNLSNTDFCDFKSDTDIQYCNCFKYRGIAQGFADALNKGVGIYSFYSVNKYEYIVAPKAIASSVNEWKAYLKSQYNAGTPVIVYYKQQTPTRLPFTDEQKAVAKELNNARTYKNVTNITTDSKAILSLDYAKDQETQNQKMQNEIDEIKQLLSTTQTSAMLLDNLQKEVESEVE